MMDRFELRRACAYAVFDAALAREMAADRCDDQRIVEINADNTLRIAESNVKRLYRECTTARQRDIVTWSLRFIHGEMGL